MEVVANGQHVLFVRKLSLSFYEEVELKNLNSVEISMLIFSNFGVYKVWARRCL